MTNPDVAHKLERFFDAVFSASNLEHKHLSIERELVQLKWYGYRFLSPLTATKLFYEEYRKALVQYLSVNKDRELAENVPVVPFDDFAKDPAKLASAWTARQRADTFDMPYELYIEFCMWFWSRRSWGGRRYAPQINQLSYTDRSEVAWRAEFEKFQKDRLWDAARSLADVPQLQVAAFMNTREQLAARAHLLDWCVGSSRTWRDLIEMWCHTWPMLTKECFDSVVDAEHLKSAVVGLPTDDPVRATGVLPAALLWPSCHGLPTAQVVTEATCANCLFSESCSKLGEMVQRDVLRTTGRKDPRKAKLRASANARQARYKAGLKAGGASPAISLLHTSSTAPEVSPS